MPTLSVVIVTHNSREAIAATLPALCPQLGGGDELVVVDNDSSDGTAELARELCPGAIVIETGANLGFSAGCNRGAEAAGCELLCLLNPDAVPAEGWRDAIERPLRDQRGWAAWQGLVTAEGGRLVNTRGGVVHFTGIAWAGGAGEPANCPDSPPAGGGEHGRFGEGGPPGMPEPGFVSGACLAVPRATFFEIGAMPEEFFLYHEDVDFSLRLRLAGGRLGVEPAARVDHDYEFAKGPAKWAHLERNRWATLIRTYPAGLLALLTPGLLATELALLAAAASQGWLAQKLEAWRELGSALPRLLAERRAIQRGRVVAVGEFARALTPDLGSAYLGAAGRSRPLALALRAYWTLVLFLLDARRG